LRPRHITQRGFTLLETAIALAVVGILAAAAGAGFAAAKRNASVGSAAFDLAVRLQGLKTKALDEQREYVLVLVNPSDDVSSGCGLLSPDSCSRWALLYNPSPAWLLSSFNVASPETNCSVEATGSFATGIVLDVKAAGKTGPVPFDAVKQLDTAVKGSCNGRSCVAVRFSASGEVSPVYATASQPLLQGLAFGLTSDAAVPERRAVLVSFPTGIVKTFAY
jgi:prepilin-type N-terminal cleavage/methylation domain-containing protein